MFPRAVSVCLAISTISVVARAEGNLGAILDGGGTKLTSGEIRALIIGNRIEVQGGDGKFSFQPKDNGELYGHYHKPQGVPSGHGNWTVGDNGKLCLKVDFEGTKGKFTFDRCGYWFQQGEADAYWVSGSDSDKSAPVHRYRISK